MEAKKKIEFVGIGLRSWTELREREIQVEKKGWQDIASVDLALNWQIVALTITQINEQANKQMNK